MQTYESLKHTTWECKYHVVFIPKYRRKALYGQLRRDLGPVFRGLAERKEGMQSGRGSFDEQSRAHAVERAAELLGVQRDGVH